MKLAPISLDKYKSSKKLIKVKSRYFDVFEFRYGVTDGKPHSLRETGKEFKISGNRASQLIARVIYEVENSGK